MSLHIITHVMPYLRSIMHMHFYCYVIGGSAYLLDRDSEWCYSVILTQTKPGMLERGFLHCLTHGTSSPLSTCLPEQIPQFMKWNFSTYDMHTYSSGPHG